MRILALDLSLNHTGYATSDGAIGELTIRDGTLQGTARLLELRKRLRALLSFPAAPHLAVIEGYAYAAELSRAHSIGEWGGVCRLELHERGIPVAVVPPAQLKQYATGKGNAQKIAVVIAARERLGYTGQNDNMADALWLLTMAQDNYGLISSPVPKTQRAVLDRIEWPFIKQAQREVANAHC